jgi:hypothetical protein
MKRFKTIFILLGVLVVACVITFVVKNTEEKKEQIKNTDEIILSLPVDEVQSLAWEYDDVSLGFHKEESWLYDEDENFPVDEKKIEDLLSLFENFGAAFIIENVEDYSQYGLDEPTCTIQVASAEQSYEVTLGAYSTMDAERYVSIGDGNVYLVKTDPFDSYEVELSDLIKDDTIPSFGTVTEIQFEGTENYVVSYEEESSNTYCADDLYFTTVNGKTVPLDSDNVSSYLSSIHSLKFSNYVSYNVTDEELEAYGLATPELTITVSQAADDNGETAEPFVLKVGRNQEELAAKEEAEAAGNTSTTTVTAYVRVGDSQIVYQISESSYEALTAVSYDDLRHEEVLTADFASITQIDISLEDELYTITVNDSVYSYQEEEISISTLQSKITALKAAEFTDEVPTGKEEISLTFYLDNENYPQVTVTLYRYDGTNCIAVVDGEPVCLVARTSVVNLIEAVNAIVLG